MRNDRIWLGAALIAAVLLLGACGGDGDNGGDDGGGGDGGGGGTTLEVTATEFSFTPSSLSAPADEEVTVELTNGGTSEHDFTIEEADLHVVAPATESGTGTFTLPAGTYTFFCMVPGHQQSGMEGTITVS